jgi:DNA replication protein DnaC
MRKSLTHARLTQPHEKEMRALLAVDLLIVDDVGLAAVGRAGEPRAHEIIFERHRAGSMIVSSNRGPDEWLATFADPMRA